MALLVVKNSMEKYLERMKFSASAKVQTKLVLKRFDTFCHRTQNKAEDEVIEELKILKKTKSEDEYKEVLYNEILQPFIDELAEFYDPMAVRGLFSYFKGYLVSWGIVIYKEETKIFLTFPQKLQDEKHVFTKSEVRSICNVASPKRRMLYLVLSSSAMRIQETVQLRKKDIEVIDGKVKIVSVPLGNQHNSFTKSNSEFVCSSCKLDNHSNSSHIMWIQDEEDVRTIICKCKKCLII